MKILANNIRALRHQHSWSQEDVANKLGISIPAFSKIETGVTDVNLSRIEQIANVLGVSVARLLSENEEEYVTEDPQKELIDSIKQKVIERENEISALQKKVIVLYEELRKRQAVIA